MSERKRLVIVIEDVGADSVFLDLQGDTERLHNGTPAEQLTLAEYWGNALAQACAQTISSSSQFETFRNMKVNTELQ